MRQCRKKSSVIDVLVVHLVARNQRQIYILRRQRSYQLGIQSVKAGVIFSSCYSFLIYHLQGLSTGVKITCSNRAQGSLISCCVALSRLTRRARRDTPILLFPLLVIPIQLINNHFQGYLPVTPSLFIELYLKKYYWWCACSVAPYSPVLAGI